MEQENAKLRQYILQFIIFEVMNSLQENWDLYLAVRTILCEGWLTFSSGWQTLIWLVICSITWQRVDQFMLFVKYMQMYTLTGTKTRTATEAKESFSPILCSPMTTPFFFPKMKERTYQNVVIFETYNSPYTCMNIDTLAILIFLYYIFSDIVVNDIRCSNFWAAGVSVNTALVLSSTKVGVLKKVRRRIFNLVSTTWVIIRNDSWTWWNCIPNWKTKLLSDRHDFLVLGPC